MTVCHFVAFATNPSHKGVAPHRTVPPRDQRNVDKHILKSPLIPRDESFRRLLWLRMKKDLKTLCFEVLVDLVESHKKFCHIAES